jgi:hypothetical protein
MSLPYDDPSLPSLPAPLFSDVDAARGDHLRANNNLIWQNFEYLENEIYNADEKTTPVDADMVGLMDSAASDILKKLSWENIKATILTYLNSVGITAFKTNNGAVLRTKIIEIGDWNMDTTATVQVAHGLSDYKKIRGVSAIIISDNDVNYLDIHYTYANTGNVGGCVTPVGANILLKRADSGNFDNIDYNSTSFNRGWVTIHYID